MCVCEIWLWPLKKIFDELFGPFFDTPVMPRGQQGKELRTGMGAVLNNVLALLMQQGV